MLCSSTSSEGLCVPLLWLCAKAAEIIDPRAGQAESGGWSSSEHSVFIWTARVHRDRFEWALLVSRGAWFEPGASQDSKRPPSSDPRALESRRPCTNI